MEQTAKSIMRGEEREVEPKLLHRLFEEGIEKRRELTATVFDEAGASRRIKKYSELNHNANRLAHKILETLGSSAKPNEVGDWIVGVCMKPSDSLVESLLAILKVGAAYLPFDENLPFESILNKAKPVLVIHDDTSFHPEHFTTAKTINFSDLQRDSQLFSSENLSGDLMLTKVNADSKAVILYTPESRIVRISHKNIAHYLNWNVTTHPFLPNESHTVMKTELTSVDHLSELWCPLLSGIAIVIFPYQNMHKIESFVDLLEEFKVRRVSGSPSLLQKVLVHVSMHQMKIPNIMLSNLKLWTSCGESLPLHLAQLFFKYFNCGSHVLVNTYGSAEVTAAAASHVLRTEEEVKSLEKIPLGLPVHNTIVYVLDDDLKPVSDDEVGEIHVAGASICQSYSGNYFIENPLNSDEPYKRMLKTGDLGMIRGGLLYLESRHETLIKVDGKTVDVSEVEGHINNLEYVSKCAILVHHRNLTDQLMIAFVSTKSLKTPDDIKTNLSTQLADYMIPQVRIIQAFPLALDGSVDRPELLKMFETFTLEERRGSQTKSVELEFEVDKIISQAVGTLENNV